MNKTLLYSAKSEHERYQELHAEFSVDGKLLTLNHLLEWASNRYSANTALIFQDRSVSYTELYNMATELSIRLQSAGIKNRDRVVLLLENSIEFFSAYFAILHMGAVVVPLNIFLHNNELLHIILNAKPAGIVTSEKFLLRLREIEGLVIPPIAIEYRAPTDLPTDTKIAFMSPADIPSSEMAVLLYTSGTTGNAKGVMLSSHNCMVNVLQSMARVGIGLEPNERVFAVLPLFHSFAQVTCIWSSVLTGSAVILIPKIERHTLLNGLRKYRPTIFLGVPALYGLLCLLKNAPLDSIKYFICGGDMLPDKIQTFFQLIYARKICNGYGMTEASPVIALSFEDSLMPSNAIGQLLCDIEGYIKIEDPQNNSTNGQIGELVVRGPNIMLGYYQEEELTHQILNEGWLFTGDLACFNEEGHILLMGRTKDLIAHKGLKIYPAEVENIIMQHPHVIRVGVIPQEDKESGQIPIAFVQVKQLSANIESELAQLCKNNLAPYKIPKKWICGTTELPTTSTGKVDKKVLLSPAFAEKL